MRIGTVAYTLASIGLLGCSLMFCGCLTPQQREMTCQAAQIAYETYQGVLAGGHQPSKDEIIAATAAAAFLHAYCAWTATDAPVSTGRAFVIDSNGVLVVRPPAVQ